MYKLDQSGLQLNQSQLPNPKHLGPSTTVGSPAQYYKKDPPQCVNAFSPLLCALGREQNREYGSQSRQYLYSWGEIITTVFE